MRGLSRRQLKKELIQLFDKHQVTYITIRGVSLNEIPEFIVCKDNTLMLFYLCKSTAGKTGTISHKAEMAINAIKAAGGTVFAILSVQHAKVILGLKD